MLDKITEIVESKLAAEHKMLQIKKTLKETTDIFEQFGNNFFGELEINYENGEISSIETVDRYEDREMLKTNKSTYVQIFFGFLSPNKLLNKLDSQYEKTIEQLSVRNLNNTKKIIKVLQSKHQYEIKNRKKEVLFLEKRHEDKPQKNRFYSNYIEDISVKYLSYLSKNTKVKKIKIILYFGQTKDTTQKVTIFDEGFGKRLMTKDNYDIDVIEKQNCEKIHSLQENKYICNAIIEIDLKEGLNEYEKLVFKEDAKINGIYLYEDFNKRFQSPIRIMDLYAIFKKSL